MSDGKHKRGAVGSAKSNRMMVASHSEKCEVPPLSASLPPIPYIRHPPVAACYCMIFMVCLRDVFVFILHGGGSSSGGSTAGASHILVECEVSMYRHLGRIHRLRLTVRITRPEASVLRITDTNPVSAAAAAIGRSCRQ